MYLVTANEMQQMDQMTIESMGIPGRVLMENAGRGATVSFLETVHKHHPGPVGIAAGRGNNGGDGFVMARYLHNKGIPTTVFLFSNRNRIAGDAAANLKLLEAMQVPVVEVPDAAALDQQKKRLTACRTWIDAILGTGLRSDVRGFFHTVIHAINQQDRPLFAVDIASGINADTGQICGICTRAVATATFGFAKTGHLAYPGRICTGELRIIEIGIPPSVANTVGCRQHLITPASVKTAMPARQPTAHKGSAGHLLVLAGSPGKTGAAAMCATAAMRSGAGLVTLGIPRTLNPILESMVTEAMTVGLPESADGTLDIAAETTVLKLIRDKRCIAVGPGLGTNAATGKLLKRLIRDSGVPMVIDADGLNLIAMDPSILKTTSAPVILTPHPGEMARLSGCNTADIQNDRLGRARAMAQRFKAHVVLKGADTIVAQPDGTVFLNASGNPGMAAGGMGDVLTGMIAGLITQGATIDQAACAGVYLHGVAADLLACDKAPVGYLASEVMEAIPRAMASLGRSRSPFDWIRSDPLAYSTEPCRP
ncbi:MAG: bifunctional ADP-dependent NAD(P)H-hydrate dehydratase/NAD(P)H-hydrate epimerase [Deltaproteobacteria bacterium]|nr:MAG: bifunctional ADP-dependent NAD(P)H-hydrate dehydratase/NAD(P)H-hydrate epimerase [Deltaproteobacteria bacterium]